MPSRARRDRLASLGLLALSLAISFSVSEMVIRRLARQPSHPGRHLFLSSPQLDVTDNGAVRYRASEDMRMVAVYDGEIEFDVTFATNNYGFVDGEAYPLGKTPDKGYVFIGNSFAAGVHGGRPWIPRLRSTVAESGQPKDIYNLGVEGTGFWHWLRLLDYIEGELAFNAVVIIGISDDFRRPYWTPMVADSTLYLCLAGESREECLRREPYASLFDRGASEDSVLELAKQYSGKRLLLSNPTRFISTQAKRSQFLLLLVRQLKSALGTRETFSLAGFKALASQQTGRDVYFLHVPQRNEVAKGRYDVDPSCVARDYGVDYVALLDACDWDLAMFYGRDPHPNERGYENLRLCVGKVLGLLPLEPANDFGGCRAPC